MGDMGEPSCKGNKPCELIGRKIAIGISHLLFMGEVGLKEKHRRFQNLEEGNETVVVFSGFQEMVKDVQRKDDIKGIFFPDEIKDGEGSDGKGFVGRLFERFKEGDGFQIVFHSGALQSHFLKAMAEVSPVSSDV
jgi:hypothetical protein